MIGRLYHLSARDAKRRADELLEQFSLTDAAARIAKTYSGGMRRRLDLAASLVALPPILFLDEPTTGLDPRSRRQMWDVIRALVLEGSTILLTTQYLEEADELADWIAVVDSGRVIAEGTSDELKDRLGGDMIEVAVGNDQDLARGVEIMRRHLSQDVSVDSAARKLSAPSRDGTGRLAVLVRELDGAGVDIVGLQLHRPSLDDVFLTLTGHAAEEESASNGKAAEAGSRRRRAG
jgi:ABC-2 type transport system ATP-binding protein